MLSLQPKQGRAPLSLLAPLKLAASAWSLLAPFSWQLFAHAPCSPTTPLPLLHAVLDGLCICVVVDCRPPAAVVLRQALRAPQVSSVSARVVR